MDPVVVIGAGISGVACGRVLLDAGLPVRVVDRGRRIGGRMASRRIDDRAVDLGASYFTAADPRFVTVAEAWRAAGLAEPWTDTFHVVAAGEEPRPKPGPVRWRAPGALRSLVEDLAGPLDVRRAAVEQVTRGDDGVLRVDGERAAAVVLAMPDAQARSLLGDGLTALAGDLDREWEPVLALVARFAERDWAFDGAFVDDDRDLAWVADDGRRRGDGAPVLVAHSTPWRAAQHLDDPDSAAGPLVAALRRVLDVTIPVDVAVQRWSLAKPVGERTAPYLLDERLVGVCGDGWGPPKVEGAYLSGLALGEALAGRLG